MASRSGNSDRKPAAQPPYVRRLDAWHAGFFLLGLLVAAFAARMVLLPRNPAAPPAAEASATPTLPGGNPGPWGRIEYTSIELERPDESLTGGGTAVPPTTWFFDNHQAGQVMELFLTNHLTAAQLNQLTNQALWSAVSNGWLILPPAGLVRSLDAPARQAIYTELGKSPRNPFHSHPFCILPDKFDAWLGDSRLPDDKKEIFRSLTYRSRENICFSDYEVMESLCSIDERKCLAKAVSQTTGLVMRLRVQPGDDIDALARYWGRGSRGKAMKPFLASLARVPGGISVSISYFLPEFARMRLYTYPDPEGDPAALREDCFWTALNFDNEKPDPRFFEEGPVRQALKTDYAPVTSAPVFGDLMVLVDSKGAAIHVSVYVADGVVFTKNGVDPFSPWLLMRSSDMRARYEFETGGSIQTVCVRRKTAR